MADQPTSTVVIAIDPEAYDDALHSVLTADPGWELMERLGSDTETAEAARELVDETIRAVLRTLSIVITRTAS